MKTPEPKEIVRTVREAYARAIRPESGLSPYLRLMRIDKPAGTWLLLLPCWWGVALAASYFPNLWLMFLFAVGAVVMRGAGCTINDIYDRRLDRAVARTQTRPLASGEVGLFRALAFLAFLLLLGLGVLLLFNSATEILGAASLLLVFTYPLMKRVTWWPQLFLGFTFNWGVLMGGTAVTGALDGAHGLAYVAGIFWTLGYDTIYAHQDKKDDATIGIKSTALLLGDKSRQWISLFYLLTIVFLALSGWAAGLDTAFYIGLLAAGLFAGVQLVLWKPDDPQNCARRFNANRDFGLIVLAAVVAGKML